VFFKNCYFFFLVHAVKNPYTNCKKILILLSCSSSIGQQIFYNSGDSGNFGSIALHPGYYM